jgi:hypothetical protein
MKSQIECGSRTGSQIGSQLSPHLEGITIESFWANKFTNRCKIHFETFN